MRHVDTSRIPDDPAYWRSLEARVTAAMLRRESVTQWLTTSRGAWVAAASIAFVAAAAVSIVGPRLPQRATAPPLATFLAPDDPLGQMLVDSTAPPMLAALAGPRRSSSRGAP